MIQQGDQHLRQFLTHWSCPFHLRLTVGWLRALLCFPAVCMCVATNVLRHCGSADPWDKQLCERGQVVARGPAGTRKHFLDSLPTRDKWTLKVYESHLLTAGLKIDGGKK